MSNRMTLEGLAGDVEQLAATLSAEELSMLAEDLEAEQARVKGYAKSYTSVIAAKYSAKASERRDDDYGTSRVDDGEYVAVSSVPKKVEWDQKILGELWERIAAAGDKPTDYIEVKYSISENKWKNWPESIQRQFLAARSVKPGAETIKIERRK